MAINQVFEEVFIKNWSNSLLVDNGKTYSYSNFYSLSNDLADYLIERGCKRGDVVGIILPNGLHFLVSYLACIMKGFVFLPINPDLKEQESDYIKSLSKPVFIIDNEDIFERLSLDSVIEPRFDTLNSEISAIFFTSGTTGNPKGVCHSIELMVSNVLAFNQNTGLNQKLRFYHILPMSYMAGFLNSFLSPLMAGGLIVLGPKFNPLNATSFWELPKRWDVNTLWLTPTIASFLTRVNRGEENALWTKDNLRRVFCGTAPLTLNTRNNFENAFGVTLLESYGMSEILLVAVQSSNLAKEKNSVGTLLKGIEIIGSSKSITDELLVKTPYMFKKYLLDEEHDQGEQLIMKTGDSGELKEDCLFITGRLKDIIIKGGINISPIFLENKISEVDGVQEVSVVGFPHDFWGEVPYAFIVAEENKDKKNIEKILIDQLRGNIDQSSVPEKYIWLNELPKSSNGKVLKNKLIEGQS